MKPKVSAPIASLLAILLATTTVAHAQAASEGTRYRVIDLGTLGGDYTEPGGINDRGEIEGWGNLAGDSQIQAFFWKNGVLTAIPGLAATNSTAGWAISNSGQVGVAGETPDPDPLGEDFCRFGNFTICRPFVWQEGTVTLLPLPAGNNAAPTGFNNINEVTGKAERAELDPTCGSSPQKLQTHGIVWRNGKIRHLLPNFPGDTQGAGHSINDLGQVVGWSGNCIGPPFLSHALLWDKGKRIDLGTLGGPNNQAYNINNKGDVVGFSGNADGSVVHGFLWHRGHMRDLGVLPGNVFSFGAASNDAGDIVGASGDANGRGYLATWHDDRPQYACYKLHVPLPA
jgi:probable HAF family extracellular repeat protein